MALITSDEVCNVLYSFVWSGLGYLLSEVERRADLEDCLV